MAAYFSPGEEGTGLIENPSIQPNRLCSFQSNEFVIVNKDKCMVVKVSEKIIENDSHILEPVQPDSGNVIKKQFAQFSELVTCMTGVKEFGFQGCCKVQNDVVSTIDGIGQVGIVRKLQNDSIDYSFSNISNPIDSFSDSFCAIATDGNNNASVIHYLAKTLAWVDLHSGSIVRSCIPLNNPTAVCHTGDILNVIGIAEGRALSIWDPRVSGNGKRSFRFVLI